MRKPGVILVVLLYAGLLLWAERHFNPPPAGAAETYPAHETHENEKVTVAIDPYDTPEKAKAFAIKYKDFGFLPVRLIISNNSDSTLILDHIQIDLGNDERNNIEPATKDDLLRRISNPERIGQPGPQLPIPIPGQKKRKQPISDADREEIDLAPFLTVPITAHSANSGFLFFDVSGLSSPEKGAHILITGMRAGAKELFYFDIPLQKAGQPPNGDKK